MPVRRSARRQGEAEARPADWRRGRLRGAVPAEPATRRPRTARRGRQARRGRALPGRVRGPASRRARESASRPAAAVPRRAPRSRTRRRRDRRRGRPGRRAARPGGPGSGSGGHPRPRPTRCLGDEWGGPAFRRPGRPRRRRRRRLVLGQVSEAAGSGIPGQLALVDDLVDRWHRREAHGGRVPGDLGHARAALRSPPGPGRALRRRRRVSSAFSILGDKTCRDEVASLPGPTRPAPTLPHPTGSLDSKDVGVTSRADGAEMGNAATGYPPPPLPARALQAHRRAGSSSQATLSPRELTDRHFSRGDRGQVLGQGPVMGHAEHQEPQADLEQAQHPLPASTPATAAAPPGSPATPGPTPGTSPGR